MCVFARLQGREGTECVYREDVCLRLLECVHVHVYLKILYAQYIYSIFVYVHVHVHASLW